MNDESMVLGIEFGNPSNPIAIGAMYNEEEKSMVLRFIKFLIMRD